MARSKQTPEIPVQVPEGPPGPKLVRFLRPGRTRNVPLYVDRQQGEKESEEDFKAYCARVKEWSAVTVDVLMLTRPEYIRIVSEYDRCIAVFQKRLESEEREIAKIQAMDETFSDVFKDIFDSCVSTVRNIHFQDETSGEVLRSEDLPKDDLYVLVTSCQLVQDVINCALRANQLGPDQKKA